MRRLLLILLLPSLLLATDITPSVRTGAYLCGADDIPAPTVFQRSVEDDSTFFMRWEVLLGVGSGNTNYIDSMKSHSCLISFYVSPFDMPPRYNLITNNINYDKKLNLITGGVTDEMWYMHFFNATSYSGTPTRSVTGTGSLSITAADSVNRVFYYGTGYWGGNTYTFSTRPVFNFTDTAARADHRAFIQAVMIDSVTPWFYGKTWHHIYFDNYARYQIQSAAVATGGICVECDSQALIGAACADTVWKYQKEFMEECRSIMVDGDSLRISINVGSESWSDDYMNALPGGTIVNFEYGFDLLQVKGKYHVAYVWNLPTMYVRDSTAAANGITFFYCAAGWDQLGAYRNSIRDYYGYSNSQWSQYARLALYYAIKSDSTILYLMPNSFYGNSYAGYYMNGKTAPYYDWNTKTSLTTNATSFDTLSWIEALTVDVGTRVSRPTLTDSVHYTYNGDGFDAKVYMAEYTNAWIVCRPLDHGDVPWGKRCDSLNLDITVTLPDTMTLLYPDGSESVTTFTEMKMNAGDGFIFLKDPTVIPSSGTRLMLRK